MKMLKNIGSTLLGLLLLSLPILAQRRSSDDEAAAAAAACGAFALVYILVILFMLAVAVVIIVIIFKYIKKDAIARGDNPSKAWFALLGLLGLLIYVLTRPQGNVMPCPSCGQSRMQGLPRCPHCGNA
jgi:predicted membrane protein